MVNLAQKTEGTQRRRPSVLIVEDTLSQALKLKASLEEGDCYVHLAQTGEDGIAAAQSEHFDLIVLDIELPGMNGFEVCRALKKNYGETIANIPVIMLTTQDKTEAALRGLANGAVDYIIKDPFAELVLLETLKQMKLWQ